MFGATNPGGTRQVTSCCNSSHAVRAICEIGKRPELRHGTTTLDTGLACHRSPVVAAAGVLPHPEGPWRIPLWGVPALLLVLGCVWIERAGAWPHRLLKPFLLVGDASYAHYLTHGLVISLVAKFLAPGLVFGIVTLIAAIAVSIVVHVLIEKPLVRRLKKLWPSRRPVSALTA